VSMDAGMEITDFIKNPPLKCWCCPIANEDGESCRRDVDESCLSANARYFLYEDNE
jgi:hypothetical protein